MGVLLRPARDEDADAYVRLWTDPEVRRFLGGPLEPARVAARLRGLAGCPGVLTAEVGGIVVGTVSVEPDSRFAAPEISYAFLPEHGGRGHARAAVGAVLRRWPAAVAVTQVANIRSQRLLTALGMAEVARFAEFGAVQALHRVVTGARGCACR
ncbi:GNAT family N-acetyltransferase [Saccharopolyspora cebuensis]|uniref:GNAT family N-acetyltransferase n=1 Tax=Saccharopolyspora cebuensis TaxID=418759 RepID=A0ABV4CP18_9PSEU